MPADIVVVCGPTASGKTKMGVSLAKHFNGEVISADSMQIYKGMDIGTATPTLVEQDGIVHHMLDVANPSENYSVARYVQEATICIEDIKARRKLPIVVGGTGLYIDALCKGESFADTVVDEVARAQLLERANTIGNEALWKELSAVDPTAAKEIHPNNVRRVIRALEVYQQTGKPISEHNAKSKLDELKYHKVSIALRYEDREDQRQGINRRVDDMMTQGLLQEVKTLLASGVPEHCTAMQAIGYKEMRTYIDGMCTLEEAIEEIKLRSRQYAKRQLTWFRRDEEAFWVLWEQEPNFAEGVQNTILHLERTLVK